MAHALRDIRNRLPTAIAGSVKGSRTEYSELAKRVAERWIEDGFPPDGSKAVDSGAEASAAGPSRVEVSHTLFAAVGDLVAGHLAIGPRKEDSARRLFAALGGQSAPDYVVTAWIRNTNRAERFAHLRDRPLTGAEEREFEEVFSACEQALIAMANRSYENMDELDEILDAANR